MHRQHLTMTRSRRIVQLEGVESCLEDVGPRDDAVLAYAYRAEGLYYRIAVARAVDLG